MRGSQNLRASPFDRVETKNLCLLVSYMPLAFIPAATSGLCGFLRTVRTPERSIGLSAKQQDALGCLSPQKR